MKKINTYILEKLHINKDIKTYHYFPKSKTELIACIDKKIDEDHLDTESNPLDLNDIYTGNIIDMSHLFDVTTSSLTSPKIRQLSHNGHFDVSEWDVSNVKDMQYMFVRSHFNGDLSKWNVQNVKWMNSMFFGSKFTGANGDISNWKVGNVRDMSLMFSNSIYNGDISNWDVRNVRYMDSMFYDSHFSGENGDISKWKLDSIKELSHFMFKRSPAESNLPKWYTDYME